MTSRGNLGLKTSVIRVDPCSRVCTRGVQSIRPGVLCSTRSIGRGLQLGTAHYCDVAEFLGQTNPQRLIVLPRLVVLARIESEVANEFAVFGDDANVEIGHQDDDSLSPIAPTETDVVECAPVAQGRAAGVVDVVVTNASLRE